MLRLRLRLKDNTRCVRAFWSSNQSKSQCQGRANDGAGDAIVTSRASPKGGVGRRGVRGTWLPDARSCAISAEEDMVRIQKARR